MIFILEDDENILSLVLYALNSANLEARGFNKPSDFFEALKEKTPNLLVLDRMLPEINGDKILQKLRKEPKTRTLPIIMLTALSSEMDKITGLDLGADDYLTKPFSALELIARIKALLRRSGEGENELKFGEISYSKSARVAKMGDEILPLRLKEFELLGLFLSNLNRCFSRDELLEIIWGYSVSNTRTIDISINTLRAKLGKYGAHIKTIIGVGYQFSSEI